MSEVLGTTSQLQLTIPEPLETDWATTIRDNCFQKIVEHDHTGSSGKGLQLTSSAFADNAIPFEKIRGLNDTYLTARNAANSADINIVKVDANDEIYFGVDISNAQFEDDGFTIVDNADNTKKVAFQVSGVTTGTTRTLTIPDANDTIVGLAATQTLTNKTLTTPVIASISNSGTITIPTGTDTLVGKATTDTLTNKSIDQDGTGNNITNIANASIKAAAAIALDKLAATTASRALVSDASGFVTAATTTSTEIGYVNGVTSAIQTQIDAKLPTTITTTGDMIYSSSGATASRLAIGTAGQVLQVSGGIPAWGTNTASPVAATSKTTTYTATTSDDTILADTSGGAWTLTLYAASGNSGRRLRVKKTTSDTGILTIDGNASETIDGSTTYLIGDQNETVELLCDGSNWHVTGKDIGNGSTVRLHTGNGHGSTNTKIRRYTTAVTDSGGSITYADSSTNGATFTINVDGTYNMSNTDSSSTQFEQFGISLNSSQLTTAIQSITTADSITHNQVFSANTFGTCAATIKLSAGDVIRSHTSGTNFSSSGQVKFTITRVG